MTSTEKNERDLKLGQCRWCLVYTCKKETTKPRPSDKDLGKQTQEHHELFCCTRFAALHVPNSINNVASDVELDLVVGLPYTPSIN